MNSDFSAVWSALALLKIAEIWTESKTFTIQIEVPRDLPGRTRLIVRAMETH